MRSPYSGMPQKAFWRSGVSEQHPLTITNLYNKKFVIGEQDKIATAGSCFAQHIARHLTLNGYSVIDSEPPPPGLPPDRATAYGYSMYSARYGNIYTVRQLKQLTQEAFGKFKPKNAIWKKDDAYFDALRPAVEPNGLRSPGEVIQHRALHLKRIRQVFCSANIFIFTLGLTEAWIHRSSGTCYPTAPGVIAGEYNEQDYAFVNFTAAEILEDFLQFWRIVRVRNPEIRFILTVSPVPLTATASDEHVLSATVYSKSVLRSVAGELASRFRQIDYFPSYELIASHFSRALFYEPNLRAVSSAGVREVMRLFFSEHQPTRPSVHTTATEAETELAELSCEEVLLEAFAG